MMSTPALSPAEAAALVDLPERRVRKEIEHGLIKKTGKGKRPSVGFEALVFLRAVQLMGLDLRVDDRMKVLKSIRSALAHGGLPETVELSSVLRLALGPIVRELTEKLEAFGAWKQKLVVRDDILGGELCSQRVDLACGMSVGSWNVANPLKGSSRTTRTSTN